MGNSTNRSRGGRGGVQRVYDEYDDWEKKPARWIYLLIPILHTHRPLSRVAPHPREVCRESKLLVRGGGEHALMDVL
jgi:hypothetical protein